MSAGSLSINNPRKKNTGFSSSGSSVSILSINSEGAGLRGEEDSEELDMAENHFELNAIVEPHKNQQGEL